MARAREPPAQNAVPCGGLLMNSIQLAYLRGTYTLFQVDVGFEASGAGGVGVGGWGGGGYRSCFLQKAEIL